MICKGIDDNELKKTNGCGSSYWLAWIFRIPKWVSKDFWCACNCHDLYFQEYVTLEKKQYADDLLYDLFYYYSYKDKIIWRRNIKTKIADIVYLCLSTKLSEICFLKAKPKLFYF